MHFIDQRNFITGSFAHALAMKVMRKVDKPGPKVKFLSNAVACRY